jgi:hypothetical protein
MSILATTVFNRTRAGREGIQSSTYALSQQERQLLLLLDGQRNVIKLYASLPNFSREQVDGALTNLLNKRLIQPRAEVVVAAAGGDAVFNEAQLDYFLSSAVDAVETQVLDGGVVDSNMPLNIDDHAQHRAPIANIERADSTLPLSSPAQSVSLYSPTQLELQAASGSLQHAGLSANHARSRMASGKPDDTAQTTRHVNRQSLMWRLVISALILVAIVLVLVKK